jgi:hypothetical protein
LRVISERDHPQDNSFENNAPIIRKGDAYWVLHYMGEGFWKVWVNGRLTAVEGLDEKDTPKAQTWWSRVRTSSGLQGWVLAGEGNFDGQHLLR